MARDILFKGKVEGNRWLEGDVIHYESGEVAIIEKRFSKYGYEATEIINRTGVLTETICQYTGLPAYWHDFENEPQESDVWEHDLLEVVHNGKKVIAEVKYEGGMFILASDEFKDSYIPLFDVVQVEDDYWVDAKVLGNVFDNPELLEVLS